MLSHPRRPDIMAKPAFAAHQQGVALVVGLIFLLITTLMAVTAMSGVIMQERMAGNLRNVSIANTGAESALRAGEDWLRGLISNGEEFVGNCGGSQGLFDRSDTTCGAFASADAFRSGTGWSSAGTGIHEYPSNLLGAGEIGNHEASGLARRPQFLIEHMGDLSPGSLTVREWDSSGGYTGVADAGTGTAAKVYRITGKSTGSTANVVRKVESYYASYVGGGQSGSPPTEPGPSP